MQTPWVVVSRGKKKGKVRIVDNPPEAEKIPPSRNIFAVLPDMVPEGEEELATTDPRREGEVRSQGGESSPKTRGRGRGHGRGTRRASEAPKASTAYNLTPSATPSSTPPLQATASTSSSLFPFSFSVQKSYPVTPPDSASSHNIAESPVGQTAKNRVRKKGRALDLFSGTGSVANRLRELGYEVVTLDIDPRTNPTICCSVGEWDYSRYPLAISK